MTVLSSIQAAQSNLVAAVGAIGLESQPKDILSVGQWAGFTAANNERIRTVSLLDAADGGTAPPSGKAWRLEVKPGDNAYGERCELMNGNCGGEMSPPGALQFHEGDTAAFAFQFLLPATFPVSTSGFNVVAQWHQTGGEGSPPFGVTVQGGKIEIGGSNDQEDVGDYQGMPYNNLWSAPAVTGKWIKVAAVMHFSVTPGVGWVEAWCDNGTGTLVQVAKRTSAFTLKYWKGTTTTKPTFSCVGSYRGNATFTAPQHMYVDGRYTVARSLAAAEASAF